MCTILVAWRCVTGAPLIVVANRDELVERPSAPPALLRGEPPRLAGGRDLLAGGTWMAVSADARVAAVTNRHVGVRDPSLHSRGELPVLVLESSDAVATLDALDASAYNPGNVLYATADVVAVRHLASGHEGVTWVGPGTHVLTTVDVDDVQSPKVARLGGRLAALLEDDPDVPTALARMESLLADHGADARRGLDAACVHMERYGTVSTSSVVVDGAGVVRYRFGQGPACTAVRADVSALLVG